MNSPIVSAQWLKEHLNDPDLIVLDATIKKSVSADTQEMRGCIPGARFFDISGSFSHSESPYPNTFPSAKQFQEGCQQLGINHASKIIVYDQKGVYSSPRAWFMFKTMGHSEVYVLDGGLPSWLGCEFPTHTGYNTAETTGDFIANFDPSRIKYIEDIQKNIEDQQFDMFDARSAQRFNGEVPEPRAGLRNGNIPHSISLPYAEVINDGKYKSIEELQAIFHHYGTSNEELVFSCGSGITACILLLAAELSVDNPTAIYDGSWTEWGTLK